MRNNNEMRVVLLFVVVAGNSTLRCCWAFFCVRGYANSTWYSCVGPRKSIAWWKFIAASEESAKPPHFPYFKERSLTPNTA